MKKTPKVFKNDLFIFTLGEITHTQKWRYISNEKKTKLAKSCVTMTDLMIKLMKKLDDQFLPLYYLAHKKPIYLSKLEQTDTIQRLLWREPPNNPPIIQPVNTTRPKPAQDAPTYNKYWAYSERTIRSCLVCLSINILYHISCWCPLILFFTLPSGLCRKTFSVFLFCWIFCFLICLELI